jgi:hypothetical protein
MEGLVDTQAHVDIIRSAGRAKNIRNSDMDKVITALRNANAVIYAEQIGTFTGLDGGDPVPMMHFMVVVVSSSGRFKPEQAMSSLNYSLRRKSVDAWIALSAQAKSDNEWHPDFSVTMLDPVNPSMLMDHDDIHDIMFQHRINIVTWGGQTAELILEILLHHLS